MVDLPSMATIRAKLYNLGVTFIHSNREREDFQIHREVIMKINP